jgi:hypothetical protein
MVVVDLALASICFMGSCHPVLVGEDTPAGTFRLSRQETAEAGYGGDLLVFQEDRQHVWAVHRVFTLIAEQRRIERLRSGRTDLRRFVTKGCVNVMPEVYSKLVDCCSSDVLVITNGSGK